jgi:hypothetical protein
VKKDDKTRLKRRERVTLVKNNWEKVEMYDGGSDREKGVIWFKIERMVSKMAKNRRK